MPENILIIDTSGSTAGVAVVADQQIYSEVSTTEFSHSETTSGLLKTCLERSNLSIQQLDKILICAGPGSFTGLRIGYALVAGISVAANLPVVQINSLAAMAASAIQPEPIVQVAIRSAGRSEFFAGFYRGNYEISAAMILSISELDHKLSELVPNEEVRFISDQPYPEISERVHSVLTQEQMLHGIYNYYLQLCTDKQVQVVLPNELHLLQPEYMRAVQAKTIAERGRSN